MTNTPMPSLDAPAVRYARPPETDEEFSMSHPERLSAALDAEASGADLDRLLVAMDAEPALMGVWARQVAASDVLSRRGGLGRAPAGFAASVMGAIAAAEAGVPALAQSRVIPLATRRPAVAVDRRPPVASPGPAGVTAARGPTRRVGARRRAAAALSGIAAAATLCVGAGYWMGQSRPALATAPPPGAAAVAPAGGGTVWASYNGAGLRTVSERTDYSRNGWQRMADADAAPMDAAAAAQLSKLLMNHAAARAEHGGMMGSALVYVRNNAHAGGCPAQAAC